MTQEEIEKYCQENQEKVNQYVAWLDYQIGFSGVGTTALDTPPDFPMPADLPDEVKEEFIKSGEKWAEHKWNCWRQTMQERLGEDPGAWVCPKIGVSMAASTLGSIKSDKKAAASRENGKLGGRPRKQ